jgi:hypothetical protein
MYLAASQTFYALMGYIIFLSLHTSPHHSGLMKSDTGILKEMCSLPSD